LATIEKPLNADEYRRLLAIAKPHHLALSRHRRVSLWQVRQELHEVLSPSAPKSISETELPSTRACSKVISGAEAVTPAGALLELPMAEICSGIGTN
jgi:hypothetical protein